MSDSSQAHGLQPTRLLCPWDFPGKSIGVGAIAFSDGKAREVEIRRRESQFQLHVWLFRQINYFKNCFRRAYNVQMGYIETLKMVSVL